MSEHLRKEQTIFYNQRRTIDTQLDKLAASSKARYLSSMDRIIRKYEHLAKMNMESDIVDLKKMEIIEDKGTLRNMKVRKGISMTYYYQTKHERKLLQKITTIVQTETLYNFDETDKFNEKSSCIEVNKLKTDSSIHVLNSPGSVGKSGSITSKLQETNKEITAQSCRKHDACKNVFSSKWKDAIKISNYVSSDSSCSESSSSCDLHSEYDTSDSFDETELTTSMENTNLTLSQKSLRKSSNSEGTLHTVSCNSSSDENKQTAGNMELDYYKVMCDEIKNKTLDTVLSHSHLEESNNKFLHSLFNDADSIKETLSATPQKIKYSFLHQGSIPDTSSFIQLYKSPNDNRLNSISKNSYKQISSAECSQKTVTRQNVSSVRNTSKNPYIKGLIIPMQKLNAASQNDTSLQNKKVIREEECPIRNAPYASHKSVTLAMQKPSISPRNKILHKFLHSESSTDLPKPEVQLFNLPEDNILVSRQAGDVEHSENKTLTQRKCFVRNSQCINRKSISCLSTQFDFHSPNLPSEAPRKTEIKANIKCKSLETASKVLHKGDKTNKVVGEHEMCVQAQKIHDPMDHVTNTSVSMLSNRYIQDALNYEMDDNYSLQVKQAHNSNYSSYLDKSHSLCRENNYVLCAKLTPCCLTELISNKSIYQTRLQHKQLIPSNAEIVNTKQKMHTIMTIPKQLFTKNDIDEDILLKFCEWNKPPKQMKKRIKK